LIFAEGVRAAYVEAYVGRNLRQGPIFDRRAKYGEIFLFYAVVEIKSRLRAACRPVVVLMVDGKE